MHPPRPASPLAAASPPLASPPLAPLTNALASSPCGTALAYLGDPDVLCLVTVPAEGGGELVVADSTRLGDDACGVTWAPPLPLLTPSLIAIVATRTGLEFFDASSGRLARVGHNPLAFWPRGVAVGRHPTDAASWLAAVPGSPGVVLLTITPQRAGDGTLTTIIATRVRALGAPWPAVAAAVSRDGGRVAGAGAAGQVWVWRVGGAASFASLTHPLAELHAQIPAERVTALAFSLSEGNETLLAAAWRGGVWRYDRLLPGALHPPCPPTGGPAPALLVVEPAGEWGAAPAAGWALAAALPGGPDAIAPSAAPPTLLEWGSGMDCPALVRRGRDLAALDVSGGQLAEVWQVAAAATAPPPSPPPPPPPPLPAALTLPPRAVAPGPAPPPFARPPRGGVRGVAAVAGGRVAWCDGDGRCGVVAWS